MGRAFLRTDKLSKLSLRPANDLTGQADNPCKFALVLTTRISKPDCHVIRKTFSKTHDVLTDAKAAQFSQEEQLSEVRLCQTLSQGLSKGIAPSP